MRAGSPRRPVLVVLDADNTLYNWVTYFSRSLRAVLFELSASTGTSIDELSSRLRAVFTKQGSVEYRDYLEDGSLAELPGFGPERAASVVLARAKREREALRAYIGVQMGLARMKSLGLRVVCLSDASESVLTARLEAIGVSPLLDAVYCRADPFVAIGLHSAPGVASAGEVGGGRGRTVVLPDELRKGDRRTLEYVLTREGVSLDEQGRDSAVVLGDNLLKDVGMAQGANVYDCWARYGSAVAGADASLLVEVTDWTREEVERYFFPTPATSGVVPSTTVDSFQEFVDLIEFHWSRRPPRIATAHPVMEQGMLDYYEKVDKRGRLPL